MPLYWSYRVLFFIGPFLKAGSTIEITAQTPYLSVPKLILYVPFFLPTFLMCKSSLLITMSLDRSDDMLKLDHVLDNLSYTECVAQPDIPITQLGGCRESNLPAMEFRGWSTPSARFVRMHVRTEWEGAEGTVRDWRDEFEDKETRSAAD